MDRAYYVLLGVFAFGALLGLFLKAKTVGIFVGAVLGLLVAGFAAGAVAGTDSLVWLTGMALMAVPVLGAILFAGAAASNALLASRKRSREGGGAS